MSEKTLNIASPFLARINAPAEKDFDKYYYEVEEKDVFKETGVDADGDHTGVIEKKLIVKKIDIAELINSQADQVGVESYIKALAIQGVDINELNTAVGEGVNDFSQCPDNLADTVLLGDKAKQAFEHMDPALRGEHTTIEGFLNSLTQETVDNYIKGRIEALTPKKEVNEGD